MGDFDREPLHVRAMHLHGVRRYDLVKPRLVRSMVFEEGKICPWWVQCETARPRTRSGGWSRAKPVTLDLRATSRTMMPRQVRMNRQAWQEYRRLWNLAVATPLAKFDDPRYAQPQLAVPPAPFSPWISTP